MALPPWVRQLQQSWIAQIAIAALIATAPALYQCAGNDFSDLSIACFKKWAVAAAAYLFAISQHSPRSASFNPNGTPNQQVAEVVKADIENKPVAVVPVASPAAREEVKAMVEANAPIKVAVGTQLLTEAKK